MTSNSDPEISFVLPCLDEAETLAQCIDAAKIGAAESAATAEILIADNGRRLALACSTHWAPPERWCLV
jgi:hypothetical protein